MPQARASVGGPRPARNTAAGGNRAGRVTNCYRRFDLANTTAPESTFFVGNVQSLQECGFIPRKGSTAEGDGYVVGVASNPARTSIGSARPSLRSSKRTLPYEQSHYARSARVHRGGRRRRGCGFSPVARAAAEPAVGGAEARATLADWHTDDMWGVHPRPSEPIGYGRSRGDGELVAAVAAADLQFLCT